MKVNIFYSTTSLFLASYPITYRHKTNIDGFKTGAMLEIWAEWSNNDWISGFKQIELI